MSYVLGIDLGTTFTAAAVCRHEGRAWGSPEVVPLGTRTSAVGSVLFVDPTGTFLFGEAAERRVVTDPSSVVREFKRRIGDGTPLVVGDVPWAAADLAAHLARWVVDTVAAREGGLPDRIAFTHPASWGRHKTSLFTSALRDVGLDDVTLLPEPQAAAISYACAERVEDGTTIAVYDLGGGTFDATVLRKSTAERFEQLGEPVGHERLGGLDFDELIFDHVRACRPEAFDRLDPHDPAHVSALGRLRRECTEAKEGLSEDTEVVIPILLPHWQAQARLVRSEFEAMIRPSVEDTVALLASAIRSAGVEEQDLGAVLLVGGSARIPLVTELLSATLGCPIAVDTDPKAAVAIGAALALRRPETAPADVLPVAGGDTLLQQAGPPVRPDGDASPLVLPTRASARRRLPRTRTLAVIGALALAALVAGTVKGLPEHLAGIVPAQAATTTDENGATGKNGGGNGNGAHGGTAATRDGTTGDPSAPQEPGVSGAPVVGPTVSGKPGVPAPPVGTAGVTTAAAAPVRGQATTSTVTDPPPPPPADSSTTQPPADPPSSSSEATQPSDTTPPAAP
jgi:molecular chaperone DnaK